MRVWISVTNPDIDSNKIFQIKLLLANFVRPISSASSVFRLFEFIIFGNQMSFSTTNKDYEKERFTLFPRMSGSSHVVFEVAEFQ